MNIKEKFLYDVLHNEWLDVSGRMGRFSEDYSSNEEWEKACKDTPTYKMFLDMPEEKIPNIEGLKRQQFLFKYANKIKMELV